MVIARVTERLQVLLKFGVNAAFSLDLCEQFSSLWVQSLIFGHFGQTRRRKENEKRMCIYIFLNIYLYIYI